MKGVKLNATSATGAVDADNRSLLVQLIPKSWRGANTAHRAERSGRAGERREGRARSHVPGLLKDPHDARCFEYYCTSQLAVVNGEPEKPKINLIGKPGIVIGFPTTSPSDRPATGRSRSRCPACR